MRAAAREVREETGLDVMLHPLPLHVTRSTAFFNAIAYAGTLRDGGEGVPVWAPWPYLFAHPRHGETARRVAWKLGVRA
jgi:8-oxo-dGTP pyrophosphatase MutT (NUDIX family)